MGFVSEGFSIFTLILLLCITFIHLFFRNAAEFRLLL